MIDNAKKQIASKVQDFKLLLKNRPILIGVAIVVIFLLCVICAGGRDVDSHQLAPSTVPFEKKDNQMTVVKESVDPRDVWTAKIEEKLAASNTELQKKLDVLNEEKKLESNKINEKLGELTTLLLRQQEALQRQELEGSLRQSNEITVNETNRPAIKSKSLGAFSKEYNTKKGSSGRTPRSVVLAYLLFFHKVLRSFSSNKLIIFSKSMLLLFLKLYRPVKVI
jgi:hypothetical protein